MTTRVFVNERPVTVADGSDVFAAVQVFDETLVDALRVGTAYVTDGVGRRVEPSTVITTGDILRVVVSARRGTDGTSV